MGRIVIEPPEKPKVHDISMKWNNLTGELSVTGIGKESLETIIVNEVEYQLDFDKDGTAVVEFKRSSPALVYTVRLKDPLDKKDERLCFLY